MHGKGGKKTGGGSRRTQRPGLYKRPGSTKGIQTAGVYALCALEKKIESRGEERMVKIMTSKMKGINVNGGRKLPSAKLGGWRSFVARGNRLKDRKKGGARICGLKPRRDGVVGG